MKIVLAGALMLGSAAAVAMGMVTKAVDWKAMLPIIQETVKKEFSEIGKDNVVTIASTGDVTGMGTTEALIDLGCCGAYTHEIVVMRMEDDKPVFARFRGQDGKVSTIVFASGSSVRNGEDVEILPKEHAVYAAHWQADDRGKLSRCTGEGYVWNDASKTFDFDRALSRKHAGDHCPAN
jgi:hypothetical protein